MCFDKAESRCVALADLELVKRGLYFIESVQEVNLSTHCRTHSSSKSYGVQFPSILRLLGPEALEAVGSRCLLTYILGAESYMILFYDLNIGVP